MRNFRVICMKKSNETSSPLTTQLFWLNIYLATFWGGRVLVVENSFLFYKKAFAKSSRQGWPPLENCAVVKWSVTSPVGPQPPENSRKRRHFRWALNWEDAYDSTTARKYRRNPKGQRLCFGPQQPLHIGLLRETCIFYKTYQFRQGLNWSHAKFMPNSLCAAIVRKWQKNESGLQSQQIITSNESSQIGCFQK